MVIGTDFLGSLNYYTITTPSSVIEILLSRRPVHVYMYIHCVLRFNLQKGTCFNCRTLNDIFDCDDVAAVISLI